MAQRRHRCRNVPGHRPQPGHQRPGRLRRRALVCRRRDDSNRGAVAQQRHGGRHAAHRRRRPARPEPQFLAGQPRGKWRPDGRRRHLGRDPRRLGGPHDRGRLAAHRTGHHHSGARVPGLGQDPHDAALRARRRPAAEPAAHQFQQRGDRRNGPAGHRGAPGRRARRPARRRRWTSGRGPVPLRPARLRGGHLLPARLQPVRGRSDRAARVQHRVLGTQGRLDPPAGRPRHPPGPGRQRHPDRRQAARSAVRRSRHRPPPRGRLRGPRPRRRRDRERRRGGRKGHPGPGRHPAAGPRGRLRCRGGEGRGGRGPGPAGDQVLLGHPVRAQRHHRHRHEPAHRAGPWWPGGRQYQGPRVRHQPDVAQPSQQPAHRRPAADPGHGPERAGGRGADRRPAAAVPGPRRQPAAGTGRQHVAEARRAARAAQAGRVEPGRQSERQPADPGVHVRAALPELRRFARAPAVFPEPDPGGRRLFRPLGRGGGWRRPDWRPL